jgi:hypothetical protein
MNIAPTPFPHRLERLPGYNFLIISFETLSRIEVPNTAFELMVRTINERVTICVQRGKIMFV